MASLPSYVIISPAGYQEDFDPSVSMTEMERGSPKYRVKNSRVLMKISMRFVFDKKADAASFFNWYMVEVKRILPFTMAHPRTGQQIEVQFEAGKIGPLTPIDTLLENTYRDVIVEYLVAPGSQ